MIALIVEEIPDVYVDGVLLPPYMGVEVEREPRPAVDLYPPTTALHGDRFETWLTKLVSINGVPWKYIKVCRLMGVPIRVEYEGRALHFDA